MEEVGAVSYSGPVIQPEITWLRFISENSQDELRTLETKYPGLVNNKQAIFGNIPDGKEFKLMRLRGWRAAISQRAAQGPITIEGLSDYYTTMYIHALELSRGRDQGERTLLATTKVESISAPPRKKGIGTGIRSFLGL